jgi:phytanoyl-CoA hydroxylase
MCQPFADCPALARAVQCLIDYSPPEPDMLTEAQKQQYQRDGYIVIPGFKQASEIAALRARAAQIVNEFDPKGAGVFSTIEQEKTTDDYFLRSDNTVRCFFEEEAFDARRPS